MFIIAYTLGVGDKFLKGKIMAKLYFRYGAMGSSKTANALMVRYNYIERNKKVVLLKPSVENRDGEKVIKSRIGLEAECEIVEDFLDRIDENIKEYDAIIVDESQFISAENIKKLADIVDNYDVPVICYGLKTDFRGKFFEGSEALMALADELEEIPTVCWCGKKARFNARIRDGKVVRDGEQVVMGGNESYISLCRKHFYEGDLNCH